MTHELATFAGGCFWCIETPFKHAHGVLSTISGHVGGREAVRVTFDPERVSYQELLDLFWLQIDPTDSGGQFADRGHEYMTAIYYHSPQQKELAEQSKKALVESGKYELPIVTEILPVEELYPAEEYHQNFAAKNPERYAQFKRLSGRGEFIEENKRR